MNGKVSRKSAKVNEKELLQHICFCCRKTFILKNLFVQLKTKEKKTTFIFTTTTTTTKKKFSTCLNIGKIDQ